MRHRLPLMVGSSIVAFAAVVATLAPLLVPHDPFAQNLSARFVPPAWMQGGSTVHLLGTDQNGRDYFSRLISGHAHFHDDRPSPPSWSPA